MFQVAYRLWSVKPDSWDVPGCRAAFVALVKDGTASISGHDFEVLA